MAETSYPHDNTPITTEAQWSEYVELLQRFGVIRGELNALAVFADASGMLVKVPSGKAILKGLFYKNDAQFNKAINANASGNPRIDRVVLRLDMNANTIRVHVIEGVPAAVPAAPAISRTAAVWDLPLCRVAVANGAANIAAGDVTDERPVLDPGTGHLWLTTTQRDNLQAADKYEGFLIYNDTTNQHERWDGAAWQSVGGGSFRGVQVARTTDTAALTSGTDTVIPFDAEKIDTDGFHDNAVNNPRLTAPAALGGRYRICAAIRFAHHTTGRREITVRRNGSTTLITAASMSGESEANNGLTMTCEPFVADLAAGDYIELLGRQDSGGGLAAKGHATILMTFFEMHYLGP